MSKIDVMQCCLLRLGANIGRAECLLTETNGDKGKAEALATCRAIVAVLEAAKKARKL